MTYLLSQYWIFTALALILGLFVGWSTCGASDAREGRRGGWLAWAGVAWIVGLFLALFKVVPGLAGHLLEVALILFAAYVVGCFIGCGGKWALAGGEDVAREPAVAAKKAAGAAFAHEDVLGVDSSTSYPGARPLALAAPRTGAGDDLPAIAGMDATTAKALRDIGVFHYDQIAGWTDQNKQWVEHHLAQTGRIDREGWVEQAGRLAKGSSATHQTTSAADAGAGENASATADVAATGSSAPAARDETTAAARSNSAQADATSAGAAPQRTMTDGARSLLAQQKKAAARASAASAAPAPSPREPVADDVAAPVAAFVSAPVTRAVAPARTPMTDGARTLAILKRKEEERAARRAATASADATPAQSGADADARPAADDRPDVAADDLKLIKGVGPKNETILNSLGVRRFAQIADWSPANAQWVGDHMHFPGRIEREQWIAQAKLLAAGIDTPHSLAVKSGAFRVDASADAEMSEDEAAAFVASLPQQAAKVDDEDSYSGARPLGLAAPRGGGADDLQLIKGIGKQNEERLHALGVWHFDQIAAWSAENVKWVGSYLAFPGRIDREHWIEQAARFSRGEKGDGPTSGLI